jgi:hypothetical protein
VPAGEHTAEILASMAAAYRDEYQRRWNATTALYPGVAELLDQLARRGVPMAVLSNKPDESGLIRPHRSRGSRVTVPLTPLLLSFSCPPVFSNGPTFAGYGIKTEGGCSPGETPK